TLLAEAMGLPAEEDWFKRQRLAGDPAATFAELQPWVEARGLDAGRVKDVLAESFAPVCESRPANPASPSGAAPLAPLPPAPRAAAGRAAGGWARGGRRASRSGAASWGKTSPAPPARIEWTTAAGTVIGRAFGPGSSLTSTWAPLASMTSVSTVHPLIDSSM